MIVILGPTCTGKTSLAEKLCLKFNGEIISADSRQVYKHMDVGTGKVHNSTFKVKSSNTLKVLGDRVFSTHLQDVVLPNRNYSVAQWAKEAQAAISEIGSRGKTAFLVGGTGFYIDVLLGNRQLAGVAPDYSLRSKLEKLSCEELLDELSKLNPEAAKTIDKKNKRRLVRAVEVSTTDDR